MKKLGLDIDPEAPLLTLDSGPVSGVTASMFLGAAMGEKNVITTDMGGTSFDVSIIYDGKPAYSFISNTDQYEYFLPKVDLQAIGAGGGSLVRVQPEARTMTVGPDSAGAFPGPVCYGWGGTRPWLKAVIGGSSCLRLQQPELDERHDRHEQEQDVRDRRRITLVEELEALLVHVHRDRERLVQRAAIGHDERLLEELQVADHRDDAGEQDRRAHHRERDVPEPPPGAGAVDRRGLVHLPWHQLQAGEEDDDQ